MMQERLRQEEGRWAAASEQSTHEARSLSVQLAECRCVRPLIITRTD
jgi:hypothetical protein